MYELLCQAEQKIVMCHTTDLRLIKPLEGSKTPPIYIVHFQCPRDNLYSLNLCTAGHLDLLNYSDDRLRTLSEPLSQQLLEILLEKLRTYEQLTYDDFLREVDGLDAH